MSAPSKAPPKKPAPPARRRPAAKPSPRKAPVDPTPAPMELEAPTPPPAPPPTPSTTTTPPAAPPKPAALPRPAGAPRSPFGWVTHLRATAIVLVLTLLVGSLGFPLVVTGFAQLVVPGSANGSLLYAPNGTAVGSTLVAPNLTAPWLFWPRPSPVDYDMFFGSAAPPGPADPALVNETIAYLQQYGMNLSNASLPLWLVSSSGSGVDPDLIPPAALIQIPRIAMVTNLSEAFLTGLVNSYTVAPLGGTLGPSYVDVVNLDLAVALALGR